LDIVQKSSGEKWARPSDGNAKQWQCHAMAIPSSGTTKQHQNETAARASGSASGNDSTSSINYNSKQQHNNEKQY